ncbi:MAG: hypothetical protein WDO68_04845 [Gammaproteobacteria bacterium]
MCPACISTAAIALAAGATSAGGMLALVARKLYLLRRAVGPKEGGP